MKVYKFKCLKCKAKTQSNSAIGVSRKDVLYVEARK